MKTSVIFTTYNSPQWLEKVFWGFAEQSCLDFDVIVADDGSGPETRELVNSLKTQLPFEISHVWHEDQGFQKCKILNKAILHSDSDYIIFTDGDCIPRRDFVATHLQEAEPGYYLSGSYFKLPMSTSKLITREDVIAQRCFDKQWLYRNGLPRTRKTLKISAGPRLAPLLNKLTPTKCNLKGSNASVWREDLLKINGFDERMQWGGLDRELGVRLINLGIKPKHVRYNAICVHLDHSRGYKDPKLVAYNKSLRLNNEKQGVHWTDFGIQQLLDEGYQSAQEL